MNITYEWDCRKVEVNHEQEGELNVVHRVHWYLNGISTETNEYGNPYTVSISGIKEIPLTTETGFILFENLTNEILTNCIFKYPNDPLSMPPPYQISK